MIDFANDPIGTKYGCSYSYLVGKVGTFTKMTEGPNDGRTVFDPINIPGSLFINKDEAPFWPMFTIGNGITLNTSYTYPQTSEILLNGIMESTKDQVDFDKFKKVMAFTSLDTFTITAVPHDQLFVTKEMIGVEDFAEGIESIKITKTNVNLHIALSKDNVNWVTWKADTSEWIPVDLTYTLDPDLSESLMEQRQAAYDRMKSELCSDTELNALVAGDYDSYFRGADKIGIVILASIEPTAPDTYDITKTYSINSISIDFVSASNPSTTTTPVTQYFNFIKVGYTPKGNVLLYADRVIQQSIAFNTLATPRATTDYINGTIPSPLSTDRHIVYMRLPGTDKTGDNGEWDHVVVNAPESLTGGLSAENYFTTNIGSMTAMISAAPGTNNNSSSSNTKIVYRGGLSNISRYTNIEYNAVDANFGWRPVAEVDITSREATMSTPAPVLPVVNNFADLVKGTCISCDYIFNTAKYDTFKNLGNAKLGLLSDYTNTKSGSFFWICVGYTKDGSKICVADRPVVTGMNLNTLITKTSAGITSADGEEIVIDNNKFRLRLIKAVSDRAPESNDSEWYSFINNDILPSKSIDEIWHTDKTVAHTPNIAADVLDNTLTIVKGMDNVNTKQRAIRYNSDAFAKSYAFKPVLIIPPKTTIQNLVVTPYSGYEVQDGASAFVIKASIVDKNNNLVPFTILDNAGNELTPYTTDDHIVDLKTVQLVGDAINVLSIAIKEGSDVVTLLDFDVFKEKNYRLVAKKSFGDIYNGWNSDTVDYFQTNPSPRSSVNKKVSKANGASYIEISPFANKVTLI